MRKSKFMIAAANSGAGKTTLTLGLLKALSDMGLNVQPFKCGPDYIDTLLHTWACENPSINLDLFMSSTAHLNHLFAKYGGMADVSVVEGVMGLFDGYNKMEGSAAAVSKSLDLPVLLVVNAQASAYSVAALLYGFKNFDPQVNVKGVIFNCVGSESHYSYLKDACLDVGLEPLGYLPKDIEFEIPSRHLGLNTEDREKIDNTLSHLSTRIREQINIERLLELTQVDELPVMNQEEQIEGSARLKIAVARDRAFSFMYHENIESFKSIGDVEYFSPLQDTSLPQADLVYLPGGYPEVFAEKLSRNRSMQQSIRNYVECGGRLLAECGGMMYLTNSITDEQGRNWPMVGLFDADCSMEKMKLSLGYRYFDYKDIRFYGHEFHYSQMDSSNVSSEVQQYGARNQPVVTKLMRYKNVIAGYTHLYWADKANWLSIFD
ncbi:cobyrinate a,c-diamide synthase [Bacteroides propionicifaciens]|uniref:cobyrinate a,c-diamide synthase n=1 Tax=Bacteroides propionicifaciens TaxID=392838 RepID=UPI0004680A79|nr:cobyrinate a,c-diamide synthase [Bacteroides propionicifaciens]